MVQACSLHAGSGLLGLLMLEAKATHEQVQGSIQQLGQQLHKPLRPLWISQASTLCADFVTQPAELDFTPVILISASATERGRKILGQCFFCTWLMMCLMPLLGCCAADLHCDCMTVRKPALC